MRLWSWLLLSVLVCAAEGGFVVTDDGNRKDMPGTTQDSSLSLVERLGYPPDAKLLIIHADDAGVAHSVNRGTIESMENGFVSSASIMVPCAWFPEIAEYASTHPEMDFGLHLTLTAEWKYLRWKGVLSTDRAPSLVNEQRFQYPTAQEVVDYGDLTQVQAELHAQVHRAMAFGVRPTHLDPHMETLRQSLGLFDTFLRVGRSYRIPTLVSRNNVTPEQLELMSPEDIILDFSFTIEPEIQPEDWNDWYIDVFSSIPPGTVSVVNIHVGYDDDELQGVTVDHPDWGSAWRARDMEFFMDQIVKDTLAENNITLITYGPIWQLLQP